MNKNQALKILKKYTFVSMGCTDPNAIALAVSSAYKVIGGEVKSIEINMDRDTYKNTISVRIPGLMKSGLKLIVALGILYGNPKKGLQIFNEIDKGMINAATEFIKNHTITFGLKDDINDIYIQTIIITTNGRVMALTRFQHGNIVEINVNGRKKNIENSISHKKNFANEWLIKQLENSTIDNILDCIDEMNFEELEFLKKGTELNLKAVKIGLEKNTGLNLGKTYFNLIKKGSMQKDVIGIIKYSVASAADARMGGLKVPIFSCFGSGSHGITLFITLGLLAENLKVTKDIFLKSIALALLITGLIKAKTGILTPSCGCMLAASPGVAAGSAFLLNGSREQIKNAIDLVFANIAGALCDGAKPGCALKMVTAASCAVESAYLALEGLKLEGKNGIIRPEFNDTLENIRIITKQGMNNLSSSILTVLLKNRY